jgi:histone H3/H4
MAAHFKGLEGLSMGELPNAVVKRLLAQHGGGLRVSGSAIDEAVKATEEYLARLARESQALAVADKRKTVMYHDITKARAKIESGGL